MDKRTLQQKLNQPYTTENWKEIVRFVFPNVQLFGSPHTIPVDNEKVESFSQLGNVRLNDGKNLALFELTLKSNVNILRNRVELNNLVSRYIDQGQTHGVLSVFEQDKDDYRFTFSAKATEFDEEEGDFSVRRTDTKRYTYVLGKNESCRTPAERFFSLSEKKETADISAIQDAFSVEKLSKEFFNGYKENYLSFVQHITGKRPQKVNNKWEDQVVHPPNAMLQYIFNGNEKEVRDFVKLMLGRLVFIHFVQKKRWLGVPAGEIGWENGDPTFLYNAFQRFEHKELFYSHFLEPLFHEALNQPGRPADVFAVTGTKVPYLNGGLFDKREVDVSKVSFPAEMFEDLLEFFNRFNFTIDESDLSEREVGIDPEMLGHIFENLLEDNKDKGAFYTPKEIVRYMCHESLKEYLKTKLEEQQLWPSDETQAAEMELDLNAFIQRKEAGQIIEFDKAIATTLRDVKICDPAIGSGAFPMGLLNEIYHCMYTLYHASPDVVGDVWDMKSWEPDTVKKNIIQNSIYGVDIENGAVDIARLRFWLSLLIEEENPSPLPNLDYKIVVGNSLVSKLGDDIIDIDWSLNETSHGLFGAELAKEKAELLKKISREQKEFFDSESDKKKLAADIRKLKINLLINQLTLMVTTKGIETEPVGKGKKMAQQTERYLQTLGWQKSIDKLKKLREKPDELLHFFDWKLDFPEVLNELVNSKPGFDITIGNPPYKILTQNNSETKDLKFYTDKYVSIKKAYSKNLYTLFIEKGVKLLTVKGHLSFIVPEGLYKTRSYVECVGFLNSHGLTKNIVTFTNYVFESAITGSIIFHFANNSTGATHLFHFDENYNLQPVENFDNKIFSTIERESMSLKNIATTFKGMVIKDRDKVLSDSPKEKSDTFLLGKNISKWSINSKRFTNYKDLKIIGGTKRLEKHYTIPRILIRRTGDTLCCAYLTELALTESTLYSTWSTSNHISTKALIAILNSSLLNFYNKKKNITNQQGFPQILMTDLEELPIKTPNKGVVLKFEYFVDKIISQKSHGLDTTPLEQQIDNLVYRLYDLTYDEVKVTDPEFPLSMEEYENITLED